MNGDRGALDDDRFRIDERRRHAASNLNAPVNTGNDLPIHRGIDVSLRTSRSRKGKTRE